MRYLWVALLLVGCGGRLMYSKEGADNQEFQRAFTDCQVKASQAGLRRWNAEGFLDACMQGQGFERQR